MLQTRDEFVAAYRNSRDFYLVSSVEGWQPRLHHKAKVAACLAIGLVVWLIVGMWPGLENLVGNLGSPALAATTIAALMVASGCLRVADARGAIDRSEEHTSELQSRRNLVCRLLLEKKKYTYQAMWHVSEL